MLCPPLRAAQGWLAGAGLAPGPPPVTALSTESGAVCCGGSTSARRSARSQAVARALSEEAEAFHQLEYEEHAAQDKQAALIAKKKARHHSHHSQHSE